ncbi:MAG TPA: gluconate 2-dehydrogenase subunit 3 family protein [Steroidobacteraceae bacterium]|jgi:gluconate 2-dehydrogenase gamma chain|nr:gluconate 2-dehydrogenase subunit 3 family protein [Steroidobacteraceae bacterium]
MTLRRRDLLTGTALAVVADRLAGAEALTAKIPWQPDAGTPPTPVKPGPWEFFTAQEAATVEALVDRIIPPDPQTPGGKDAGCAVFIDRQLAGGYGHHEGLYNLPPFHDGIVEQGPQSAKGPADTYRAALAALERYCRAQSGAHQGKGFAELPAERQDEILHGLESGTIKLEGVDGQAYFKLLIKDTQQGFFADPIYGGNRNMCAWKMIGFPGARYDYRDWVTRHNERYPYPPVSIGGRPEWTPGKA